MSQRKGRAERSCQYRDFMQIILLAAVEALARIMKTVARVRRDGQALEIDATELVPGDVVLMEAGSQVPADGRIWMAATLDIEEAALTGESLPVAKDTGRPRGGGAAGLALPAVEDP